MEKTREEENVKNSDRRSEVQAEGRREKIGKTEERESSGPFIDYVEDVQGEKRKKRGRER